MFGKRAQNPILVNALIFWIIKGAVMAGVYFELIAPNITNSDPAVKSFINIAYGFLTIFVVFALNKLELPGFLNFGK